MDHNMACQHVVIYEGAMQRLLRTWSGHKGKYPVLTAPVITAPFRKVLVIEYRIQKPFWTWLQRIIWYLKLICCRHESRTYNKFLRHIVHFDEYETFQLMIKSTEGLTGSSNTKEMFSNFQKCPDTTRSQEDFAIKSKFKKSTSGGRTSALQALYSPLPYIFWNVWTWGLTWYPPLYTVPIKKMSISWLSAGF